MGPIMGNRRSRPLGRKRLDEEKVAEQQFRVYQYRPPEAGDRVLVCIRPAGLCHSTRPSLT